MKCSSKIKVTSLGLVVATLFLVHPVAGQVNKRVIPFPAWASSIDEDDEIPLELVEIKVAGRPVILGQAFDADESWLKNMTLLVKNVGSKPIIAFEVGGGLLAAVDEELPRYASFRYGIGWTWGKGFAPEKEKAKGAVLKPGQIVELSYVNVNEEYRQMLAKEGTFSKLKFMAPGVQYQDGTVDLLSRMRFYGNTKP